MRSTHKHYRQTHRSFYVQRATSVELKFHGREHFPYNILTMMNLSLTLLFPFCVCSCVLSTVLINGRRRTNLVKLLVLEM